MTRTAAAGDPGDWGTSRSIRALARIVAGMQRQLDARAHTPDLGLSTIEGGAIDGYTPDGQLTTRTGQQHDGTFTSATLAGPLPPTPTTPVAVGAPGIASIAWDGGWLDGALTPMDFAAVEVYVSTSPILDPMPTYLVDSIVSSQGGQIVTRREAGTYYVRLASRSLAGKVSALSAQVEVEVASLIDTDAIEAELAKKTTITRAPGDPDVDGVAVGDLWWRLNAFGQVVGQWTWDGEDWQPLPVSGVLIAAETIGAMQIAADSISADRLLAGTITSRELAALAVTAGKIAANAIQTGHLAAGAVTADKVAAGAITAQALALGIFRTQRVANSGFEITSATGPSVSGTYSAVPGWTGEAGANTHTSYVAMFPYNSPANGTGYSGVGVARLSNTGAGLDGSKIVSDPFQVTPGEALATTAQFRNSGGACMVGMYLRFYNAAGALISTAQMVQDTIPAASSTTWAPAPVNSNLVPAGAVSARLVVQNRQNTGTANFLLVDDVAVYPVGVTSMDLAPGSFRMWNDLGVITTEITSLWARFPNVEAQNLTVNGSTLLTGETIVQDSLSVRGSAVLLAGATAVLNATSAGATFAGAGSLGVTSTITVTAPANSSMVVDVFAAAMVTSGTASADLQLWRSGAVVRIARVQGVNDTTALAYSFLLAPGQSQALQLVAAATGAMGITADGRFTYLYASTRPA